MRKLSALFAFLFSGSLYVYSQTCPTSFSYQTSGANKTFSTETWSASSGSVSPGGTPPVIALTTPVNSAFSTATTGGTLAAGTYYYRVSALNSLGETLASTETSKVTTGSTSTVTVNWGAVSGATGYKVYGRSTGSEQLIATVGAVTTYTDTGSGSPSGALPTSNTTSWAQNPFHWSYNNTDYSNSIVIPAGVVLDIEDNSFDISPYTYLIVKGTLVANGKVNLPSGGGIIIDTGGLVCCDGSCNASDRITIGAPGGTTIWGGSTGNFNPVSGPASCTGSCTTLPVILNGFKAHVNQASIDLTWSTSSEINFDYFSLQKSADGTTFNEITQVKGHGTTNETHNYSYEDKDPIIGQSYYRLASIDFDGYRETFRTISVEYHGEKKFTISPNPSDGLSANLNFNFRIEEDGVVTIYDNVGSVVGIYPVTSHTISFANPLKSGVYLAKYSSSSLIKTDRFMVK